MTVLELNTLLLCFTAALCTFALFAKSNPDWNAEQFLSKKNAYLAAVGVLLLAAVLVRCFEFGEVPAGVNQDGAMAAVDAKALADYGTDRFGMRLPVYFTAWGYGQMSVLLSYCMAPFIKLFGFSVFTVRLPMLLASLAGVWVLFRFAHRLFGRMPALLALAFIAIDPWHIMQSRWALDCNLFPHFLLFSLYFLHLGLEKRRYLYISMFFFALTMYAYGIAFYCVPLLLAAVCAYLLVRRLIRPWEAGVCALVYLAFAWPIFAVVVINTFKLSTLDTGLVTIAYFPDSIRMNDLLVYSKEFLKQLFVNIQAVSDTALLEKGDFNWNYIANYGRMYLFTLPFTIVGLWRLIRWGRQKRLEPEAAEAEAPHAAAGRFLLVAWLAVALFSGLMVNRVNTNRINIIFYPLCLLASLGIWHVLFRAVRVRKIAAAVAVIYALSFGGFTVAYFGNHAQALAKDFCSGLTDAVAYADGLDADVLYITSYSRSETSYSCSEVYTLFGAKIDAKYFQGVSPAYGPDGRELLPYAERYQYVHFEDGFDFNQPQGTVCVFNAKESDLFSDEEYAKTTFGGFGVAVKTTGVSQEPVDESGDVGDGDSDGEAVG